MAKNNSLFDKHKRDKSKDTRKVDTQNVRVYFLIVCGGKQTEPNYFSSFEKNLPQYTLDIELKGEGKNPSKLIDKAVTIRDQSQKKYDSVWVVFDKDDFTKSDFNNAINEGPNKGIKCAWSNESFELWYLLHFKDVSVKTSRTEYIKELETVINRKLGGSKKYKYKKSCKEIIAYLSEYGSQKDAIDRAELLDKKYTATNYCDHNPRTKVYKLVKLLNNPSKLL